MTGDSEKIEDVVNKVDCLVLDIETVRFDPYNPLNRLIFTNTLYIDFTIIVETVPST